jgi:hypothetical protein
MAARRPQAAKTAQGRPGQEEFGRPAGGLPHTKIPEEYALGKACAQSLHRRLLGGETRGHVWHGPGARGQRRKFPLMQNPDGEAPAKTLVQPPDAGKFHQVYAYAYDHVCRKLTTPGHISPRSRHIP